MKHSICQNLLSLNESSHKKTIYNFLVCQVLTLQYHLKFQILWHVVSKKGLELQRVLAWAWELEGSKVQKLEGSKAQRLKGSKAQQIGLPLDDAQSLRQTRSSQLWTFL